MSAVVGIVRRVGTNTQAAGFRYENALDRHPHEIAVEAVVADFSARFCRATFLELVAAERAQFAGDLHAVCFTEFRAQRIRNEVQR